MVQDLGCFLGTSVTLGRIDQEGRGRGTTITQQIGDFFQQLGGVYGNGVGIESEGFSVFRCAEIQNERKALPTSLGGGHRQVRKERRGEQGEVPRIELIGHDCKYRQEQEGG
jgi:hypothetical protein